MFKEGKEKEISKRKKEYTEIFKGTLGIHIGCE